MLSPTMARAGLRYAIPKANRSSAPIGNSRTSEVRMGKTEKTEKTANAVPPDETESTTGSHRLWIELPICPFCSKDTVEYVDGEWRCRTCPAGTIEHQWLKNRFFY